MKLLSILIGVLFEKKTYKAIPFFAVSLFFSLFYSAFIVAGFGIGFGTLLFLYGFIVLLLTVFGLYQIGRFEQFVLAKIYRIKTKKVIHRLFYVKTYITKQAFISYAFVLLKTTIYMISAIILLYLLYLGFLLLSIPFVFLQNLDQPIQFVLPTTTVLVIDSIIPALFLALIGYFFLVVSAHVIRFTVFLERVLIKEMFHMKIHTN